jgi:membrane protease YdiL (CAAX protease family)
VKSQAEAEELLQGEPEAGEPKLALDTESPPEAQRMGLASRILARLERMLPHGQGVPLLDRKTIIVLLSVSVLLTFFWYYGRLPFFHKFWVPRFFADEPREMVELYAHFYLSISSIIFRMLLPLLLILFVLRERPRDYGYRVRGTLGLFKIYLFLLAVMLPLLFIASGMESFQAKYPLNKTAANSLGLFLTYELSYIFVFVSGEAFWRGYIVNGLAPKFGLYALPVMAIPYAMVHFGKPFPESLGAILAGIVLGYIALKHRSFWFGIALHATIAVSMDLLVLWRKGQLWPLLVG